MKRLLLVVVIATLAFLPLPSRLAADPPDLAGAWSVAGTDSARGAFTGTLDFAAAGTGAWTVAGARTYANGKQATVAGAARLSGNSLTLDLTLGGPGIVERVDGAVGAEEKLSGTYTRAADGSWTGNWRTVGGANPAAGPERLARGPATAATGGTVEILDLTDYTGTSVLSGTFDVRSQAESPDGTRKAALRYRVKGGPAKVTLRIEYSPADRVHVKFYKPLFPANPAVVTLVAGEEKTPGDYTAYWDGRDASPAKRLLLGGRFFVVATPGADAHGRPTDVRKSFKVPAPAALCVGPKFAPGFVGEEEDDCGFEVAPAHERLPRLKDGSGFKSVFDQTATAQSVMEQLSRKLSVFVYSGHGNYGRIWFYGNKNDRRSNDANASVLTCGPSGYFGSSPAVILPSDGKPLKDVFLVMTFSCLTGGVSYEKDFPGQMTKLGADVVIAFKHTVYSGLAVPFIQGLFVRLKNGQDVEVAARSAAQLADRSWSLGFDSDEDHLENSVVIQKADGLPNPLTLTPARYGDSSN